MDGRDDILGRIAQMHCNVDTLETRNRDSLDFHEISVWGLRAALEDAFDAGAAQQLEHMQDEAPFVDSADKPTAWQILNERLDGNLAEMMGDLRSNIAAPGLSQKDMVELAERITAVSTAYEYLIDGVSMEQAEYLIQLENPLEVVADQMSDGPADMYTLLCEICDKQDALQNYPLAATPEASAQEEAPAPKRGKPSLLASLREAQAKTRPPTAKHTQHYSGPEL